MRIGTRTSLLSGNSRFGEDMILIQAAESDYDDNGRWIEVPGTEISIRGNMQPATPDQRKVLPEGDRIEEAHMVYFKTDNRNQVRPVRVGTNSTDADVIIANGLRYIVRDVSDWSTHGHIEALVTREDGQNDNPN